MKKLELVLGLGLLGATTLFADYKMTITDDTGSVSECIKSYSFSNNLESLYLENNFDKDVYSQNEVLTNKIYMGKPIYRKVFRSITQNSSYNIITGLENIENAHVSYFILTLNNSSVYTSNDSFFDTESHKLMVSTVSNGSKIYVGLPSNHSNYSGAQIDVVLEYSKSGQSNIDGKSVLHNLKSYVHYIPSSSTDGAVLTKELNDIGIRIEKGYSFNSSTEECIK